MKDRANCVPRALSVATGLALDETTAILAAHGRKANRRTRTKTLKSALKGFGRCVSLKRGITIERFARERASGTYLVRVRGHMLAIVDGVPSDSTARGRRIVQYWALR
jgi:hypothetical protein